MAARSAEEVSALLAETFHQSIAADELDRVESGHGETWWRWKGGKLAVTGASGRVTGLKLNHLPKPSQSKSLSMQEAEQLAVDFLQTYLDPKVTQLLMVERKAGEAGRPHRFRFQIRHDGIPVIDRPFEVSVDQHSGQIVAFSGDFHAGNAAFPDKKNIVSAERAAAEYLRRFPLHLAYIWPYEDGRKAESPRLVYTSLVKRSNLVYRWFFPVDPGSCRSPA